MVAMNIWKLILVNIISIAIYILILRIDMVLQRVAKLFARCRKCRRLIIGFKELKENGYFENYNNFICKKCRES